MSVFGHSASLQQQKGSQDNIVPILSYFFLVTWWKRIKKIGVYSGSHFESTVHHDGEGTCWEHEAVSHIASPIGMQIVEVNLGCLSFSSVRLGFWNEVSLCLPPW